MVCDTWGSVDRPLVVLLHALGCHRQWWRWMAPTLSKDFYVVAPDFRGHGDSAHPDTYSFNDYAGDVEELVAGKGPYALVGHSMGGYVGLQIASRAVQPPFALVVADMKTSAPEEELDALRTAARRPSRSYGSLAEAVGRYRLSPAEHVVPSALLDRIAMDSYREQANGTWIEAFDRRALAIEPLAPMDLIAQVRRPMLFLRGEHSSIMPAGPAQDLASAAKSDLLTMPGLHHHLPLEDPLGLAERVSTFLKANGFGA